MAIPALQRDAADLGVAYTYKEKARLLAAKFFPNPEADLRDITDTTWADSTSKERFLV